MSCICTLKGCEETQSYRGITSAFGGAQDGSSLELCSVCSGVVSRTPTARERLYAEGRLGWQSWKDRTHSVPLEDLDKFAVAFAAALPRLHSGDESFGETLPGAALAASAIDGGFGGYEAP
jgi:hypothetical protein